MMVHWMGSLHFEEVEDLSEEEYGSLTKRCGLGLGVGVWSPQNHEFPIPPSHNNPLDEPSPLGLRLRKSPSLLDLIQMRLSQGKNASIAAAHSGIVKSEINKDVKQIAASGAGANDKLKASNFPASLLRIGSWEYASRYEGDLVAKCYFAKHKLVWEVLEGGLKSKIEIQWSDIMALKAVCPDNGPGSLTIVLARQPVFFRETNPQPRKHTLWQTSSDFTDGQASINRQHYLQGPPDALIKHYEKLIQCDTRLSILSRQPEIVMESRYFESEASVLENSEESKNDGCNHMPAAAQRSPSSVVESAATAQLSSSNFGLNALASKQVSKEAPLPSSVIDAHAIEGDKIISKLDTEGPKSRSPLKAPKLHPSMSMSDLVNHVGNCISEQITSGSLPSDKASECQDLLENIAQVLLSDTQYATSLDEKSLMKKVNSLCCLLQDPVVDSSGQVNGEKCDEGAVMGNMSVLTL
ncbi:hypothetical protein DH2020_014179 [Rehmannia glutinosa]|uniref:TRF2/HOY1 PH-like domain-containing protein n=1 Tax=Rehmannia glutinosa TaxID=99300 RepID=A0ABR0WZ18_REHGL